VDVSKKAVRPAHHGGGACGCDGKQLLDRLARNPSTRKRLATLAKEALELDTARLELDSKMQEIVTALNRVIAAACGDLSHYACRALADTCHRPFTRTEKGKKRRKPGMPRLTKQEKELLASPVFAKLGQDVEVLQSRQKDLGRDYSRAVREVRNLVPPAERRRLDEQLPYADVPEPWKMWGSLLLSELWGWQPGRCENNRGRG
jgi:hypothetical protein